MNWWQRVFHRRRLEKELEAELRFHFEQQVADAVRTGMSEAEARRRARLEFGGIDQVKEECRDARGTRCLESITADLRLALRVLVKSPGFSTVALITLALGIGANTAVFSVVKAMLLDSLPYRNADRVVQLTQPGTALAGVDWAALCASRKQSQIFESVSVGHDGSLILEQDGAAEVMRGMWVSHEYFRSLGTGMLLGRDFLPYEDVPPNNRVVVLTYGAWLRRFGGDRAMVGQLIRPLNHSRRAMRIIGVLPPDFRPLRMSNPGELPEYYMPIGLDTSRMASCYGCRSWPAIGRMKPGFTAAEAQAEMNGILGELMRRNPGAYTRDTVIKVTPLQDHLVGRMRTPLWILMGAAALVLLIACANVANLFLARAAARSREMAVRTALGGGRWRIIRQLLAESTLLALVGGAAGVLLAWRGVRLIVSSAPVELARLEEVRMDPAVLLFSLAVSIGTGLLFGIAPALRASRVNLMAAMKLGSQATLGSSGRRLRNLLVAGELALAFALVVGTGLLAQSFHRLMDTSQGYDPDHLLTCTIFTYPPRYPTYDSRLAFYTHVAERMRTKPGVLGVGMANTLPLSQTTDALLHIQERPLPNPSDAPTVDTYIATPEYFPVMRIPLKRGRGFTANDHATAPRVALVSESCARRHFAGTDPIGKHIILGSPDGRPWAEVVGVVGDVRQHGPDRDPDAGVYVPQAQAESWVRMVVRTRGDPSAMVPVVKAVVRELDATQAVWHFQPMETWTDAAVADRRFLLGLIGLFGTLALTLAAVGVYGMVSYSVGRRTREVGLRMALGAEPRTIVTMVLREVSVLLACGLAAGFLATLALGPVLARLLFQVEPGDTATTIAVALVLAAAALSAGYFPARRAARIDPADCLRWE